MKILFYRPLPQTCRPVSAAWRVGGAVALIGLFLCAASVSAGPSVKTITGGPTYGNINGATDSAAKFHTPIGLALDSSANFLFVADRDNNAIREIDLAGNLTFAFTTNGIKKPVGVALDDAGNVFVLNRGNGTDGTVLEFDSFGHCIATNAVGLVNANGMALDAINNIYVTVRSNTVVEITPAGSINTIAVIGAAGTLLQGIAVMDNGYLAVCDAGRNGVLLINPANGAASNLTGFNGAGDQFGTKAYAQFNQPSGISEAGGGLLVVSDSGNNRVKVIDFSGTVTNLYGVASNYWVTGSGTYPGWWDGAACSSGPNYNCSGSAEARLPMGVLVAPDGSVYTTEDYYHLVRQVTATGLPKPGFRGQMPRFNGAAGLALDSSGTRLYIADGANNAIEVLNLANNDTSTFLNASNGIAQPSDVLLDASDNIYVLNQGTGGNGTILKFDGYGNLLTNVASGLASPAAFTLDGSGNILVADQGGMIQKFNGTSNFVATVAGAGVQLQGIALFDDGTILVSDAGNHVIWQVNAVTKAVTLLTGAVGVPGNQLGSAAYARLNQPRHLARASGNLLVAADYGNNRLVVVDRSGSIANALNSTNSLVWFGLAGDPRGTNSSRFVPMTTPVGVAVGSAGGVFASEIFYNDIREILNTGLARAGQGGGGGGSGTNVAVLAPIISPNTGYYPMGQTIMVSSPNPNVYYTIDGTVPTTNSPAVNMTGNIGFITWFGSTNDLTSLKVKAFVGTNASVMVSGQSAPVNTIGTPSDVNGSLYAGIGSTIVVPVVINLQTNTQIQSFAFRVEVAPNGAAQPITPGIQVLSIGTNDFIPLATAARAGEVGNISVQPYNIGAIAGMQVSALGAFANISFQNYAVVALLRIPIPPTANSGDTYSVAVSYPSATSDGLNAGVNLAPMPAATILVTNIPYTVGDSASPFGHWYNAGGFGDTNLDNSDVNNAFYAALGLRVPYTFSDVFNAMDAYPPDAAGFSGGDGQIRFLDWQVILQRSLRLDTNNWARVWSVGGILNNGVTKLANKTAQRASNSAKSAAVWPWYRQVLLGAAPVGNAIAGNVVNVPVYAKLANGATLSGLQFCAVVTAKGNAPPIAQAPQFTPSAGFSQPSMQQSFRAGQKGFGWPVGSFSFLSRSSNFLGWVSFTLPATAQTGQIYTVGLTEADGSPDLNTQYDFETKSAAVVLNGPAAPASICSDEWKLHFFDSLDTPMAADLADPDGDGVPNWMEYLAGTDPTDPNSKLRFNGVGKQMNNGKSQMAIQWLTAPGKAYEVQWSTSPLGGAWNTLGTVSGDGSVTTCSDTNSIGAARYYRLHVLP